ncbi:RsiV family protein [uncultured Brachyspira sp.]|uniref:RsiV family protein n=1 Tax=uncultured Brachyspira sp. TaxID=221953 RepID=UPI0026376D4B|nr:RsiV family protein [uncultured Brachyspira sp.]
MIRKNIIALTFILLIISCSNNNNIDNTQTNTNLIETNELKQGEELNNDNTKNDSSYTQKNIEWISHHYYMKNDEGDFFSVYLNDRWPDNNSELMPNYEKIKAAFNYKNLNDVNQFYDKNSTLDITNNRIYAEAENGDSIESTYSNITSFKMTSKSLNSSSKEINTTSSLKAAVYNYAYSDVSETNEYGSASTFSYKDSIFLLIPDDTNKLEAYDKISFDINEGFNLDNIERNENLEFEDKKGSISKLFENNMSDFYNEWLTNSADSYESSKSINITYFNDKTISIKRTSTLYLGGAHGVYNNYNLVYSLETGEKIEVTNLIKDFDDGELKSIVGGWLLSIDNRTEEDYLVPLDEITLADTSFYIYADGIHFVWPIYTITPYVLGETEIVLSFNEIRPFIKDEYLYILDTF